MRVAAFQFDVRRGDVGANLAAVERGLRAASEQGVELVVLPEMWATSFVAEADAEALRETDAALERVRALSRELRLAVAGSAFGAPPTGAKDTLPRNRLTLIQDGEDLLTYDKVHLFSPTAEHLGFSGGTRAPATVDCGELRVSGAICYDLRFASLLRAPFDDGAELLLVPAQWPETRSSHWRALVVGRAVEHQAFVVAANRTGADEVGRRKLALEFSGNSLIVSPHGHVLAEGRGEVGLVVADVDADDVRELRRRVPVRADERRLDS